MTMKKHRFRSYNGKKRTPSTELRNCMKTTEVPLGMRGGGSLEKSSRETRPTFGFAPAAAFGAPEEDAKTEVPRPGRCRRGVLLEASH